MWKKVIAPALLVSLLWLAGSAVTRYYLREVNASHTGALVENVTSIRAAWAMLDALWRLQVAVLEANGKDARETQIDVADLEAAFEQYLSEAERAAFTTDERDQVDIVREHFHLYRDHIDARLRLLSQEKERSSTQDAEVATTMRLVRGVAEPCRQLVTLNEQLLAGAQDRAERLSFQGTFFRNLFLVAGPILGLLCGLQIARSMHRSLSQVCVTLKGVTGEQGGEYGSVEVSTSGDIPELKQLSQAVADRVQQIVFEREEARRQALSAERLAAVGELAAGIAHELRNPLTSVKLLVQTARQQLSGHPFGEVDLQVAQREISRMEGTIQGLLDFARPPTLRRVIHDLRGTTQRALNLIDGRAKQQGVTVVMESPDEPVRVNGDPEQIHQVLVNLLLNGLEAMPEGGRLDLTIQPMEERDDVCRVTVADSGGGISPEILGRVFEPFVTSKESGTGLGLAISRRIVEEHGGTLRAMNRETGGALFVLELPRSDVRDKRTDGHLAERKGDMADGQATGD